MKPIRDEAVIARMRLAFDLYQTAEDMMRCNLRRRFPEANEKEIERRLVSWLRERPGAEHGDMDGGRVIPFESPE